MQQLNENQKSFCFILIVVVLSSVAFTLKEVLVRHFNALDMVLFKIDFVNEIGEKKLELLYYQDKIHLRSNDLIDSSIFNYKDEVTLLIMLDNTSCEIFINHGKETMSKRVYFNSDKLKLEISKKEHIDSLIIAELDI